VINPDDVIRQFGADALRLYEMFMGPLDERKPWTENGVKGVFNFLTRAHRFFADPANISGEAEDPETEKLLHKTIWKVSQEIESLKFNTAISFLMVFNNHVMKRGKVTKETACTFARILSPFAPHLGEELWSLYGNQDSLAYEKWPEVNEKLLVEDVFEYPVSFNGKMRFKLELPVTMDTADIENAVKQFDKTEKYLQGKTLRKIIVVPQKIINIVTS
jgi:leucyl-tRNA synthetase